MLQCKFCGEIILLTLFFCLTLLIDEHIGDCSENILGPIASIRNWGSPAITQTYAQGTSLDSSCGHC